MKPLARGVEALGVHSAWLDGKAVIINTDGIPDVNALQNAFDEARIASIVHFLFYAPLFDGYDLRRVPPHARRALLKQILGANGTERFR